MEQGQFVLDLFQKRIEVYSQLKDVLRHQQEALIDNDIAKIKEISAEQLGYLEKINEYENTWRDFLEQQFPSIEPSQSSQVFPEKLNFSEKEILQIRRWQKQLRDILLEIKDLKESNQVLMENSLSFVRSLLNNISNGVTKENVYHPHKKSKSTNRLINRTL
ncbi:MAG: hypothetical protein GWN61_23090 [candidate division Zixibacteria bacterium]|nr:flagellar protein FlgN [candidate division KSB1 bacterium]NIS48750.1 flagellar protein FlgN [candidate division Zixibacteria bacterium]NIV08980.1 hypothetical protein [candidate division Zixibacteria bacterium]NIW22427.1 hypothetical protein [candidate division KSB1 bacterium]NIW73050.1 hypothetical protein [candidate division KSB1 bacterium]